MRVVSKKKILKRLEELIENEPETKLFSGFTGEVFRSKTFMAPALYQRLKHIASEKVHVRSTGKVDALTHQPPSGKSKDGGLRVGNMETDALCSHGSMILLNEIMFKKSDYFQVPVCVEHGFISCKTCTTEKFFLPYASKIYLQFLQSSMIGVKIK